MVWNKEAPQNQDQGIDSANDFRANFSSIENTFSTDHNIPDDAAEGEHKKVTLTRPLETSEIPTSVADKGFVYTKNVAANQTGEDDEKIQPELFFLDEDGNEIQITEGGRIRPRTIFMQFDGTNITFVPQTSPETYLAKRTGGNFSITIPEQPVNFFTYAYNVNSDSKGFARVIHETKLPDGSEVEDEINTFIKFRTFNISGSTTAIPFVLQIMHAI